jgi:putative FmdB family regulatory protein
MPIYEFYCRACHTVFDFLSKRVDTTSRPKCPRCKRATLEREVSRFAAVGRAKEEGGAGDLPMDEGKMERALESLAGEAGGMDENDPRQAANLMRKLSRMTGMKLGGGMEEALNRMEAGEDPEQIESELGDRIEEEDPFEMPEGEKAVRRRPGPAPRRDPTLYEMP